MHELRYGLTPSRSGHAARRQVFPSSPPFTRSDWPAAERFPAIGHFSVHDARAPAVEATWGVAAGEAVALSRQPLILMSCAGHAHAVNPFANGGRHAKLARQQNQNG